jgi:hypothetical protein
VAAWCLAVFLLVLHMDQRLPVPLTVRDAASSRPHDFIEERARRSLRALTSVGARPAGSYENEVLAVDLIRKELESIKAALWNRNRRNRNFLTSGTTRTGTVIVIC